MTTDNQPAEAKAPETPASPTTAGAQSSVVESALRLVLPAVLAAAAAYGGTRIAAARSAPPAVQDAPHATDAPPGPTLPLDPFLVTIFDSTRKAHPMKLSIAIEFDAGTKDDLDVLVPRVRDAMLAYLRTLAHEDVVDPAHLDKIRAELLARCHVAGAASAERVLVTDFVVQ